MKLVETREQIIDNVIRFNSYAKSSKKAKREFFNRHMPAGSHYVYLKRGNLHFLGPSRFVGYVGNTDQKHLKSSKSGTRTSKQISKILGDRSYDEDAEQFYIDTCERHGLAYREWKLKRNSKTEWQPRLYWSIAVDNDASVPDQSTEDDNESVGSGLDQLDPIAVMRLVKHVERGPSGDRVKRHNEYRCQICEALGLQPVTFETLDGVPYIEAHHAVPVSKLVPGTLHVSYIMTLCATHHRQMHFGRDVAVEIEGKMFVVNIDGRVVQLSRFLPSN